MTLKRKLGRQRKCWVSWYRWLTWFPNKSFEWVHHCSCMLLVSIPLNVRTRTCSYLHFVSMATNHLLHSHPPLHPQLWLVGVRLSWDAHSHILKSIQFLWRRQREEPLPPWWNRALHARDITRETSSEHASFFYWFFYVVTFSSVKWHLALCFYSILFFITVRIFVFSYSGAISCNLNYC